jgi:hypothetical protein
VTPEVRQAWLNAGDWVVANWPNLAVAAALGIFAWWSIRRAARQVDQILHTDPPAIDTQPGTDNDLLLDCIAIAGDLLRTNDTEARKEKP